MMNKIITGLVVASTVAAANPTWRFYTIDVDGDGPGVDKKVPEAENAIFTLNMEHTPVGSPMESGITELCTLNTVIPDYVCVDATNTVVDDDICITDESKPKPTDELTVFTSECEAADFKVSSVGDVAIVCTEKDGDYQFQTIEGEEGIVTFGEPSQVIPEDKFPALGPLTPAESYKSIFKCSKPEYKVFVPEGSDFVEAEQDSWVFPTETCGISDVEYTTGAICRDTVNNMDYDLTTELCTKIQIAVGGDCAFDTPSGECPVRDSCTVKIGETDVIFKYDGGDLFIASENDNDIYIHNSLQEECNEVLDGGCYKFVNVDKKTDEETCAGKTEFGTVDRECRNTRDDTPAPDLCEDDADASVLYCIPVIEEAKYTNEYTAENCKKDDVFEGVCKIELDTTTTLLVDVKAKTISIDDVVDKNLDCYSADDLFIKCNDMLDDKCPSVEVCAIDGGVDVEDKWESCTDIQDQLDAQACGEADSCAYRTLAKKKCENRTGEVDCKNTDKPSKVCFCNSAIDVQYAYAPTDAVCGDNSKNDLSLVINFSDVEAPEDAVAGDSVEEYCAVPEPEPEVPEVTADAEASISEDELTKEEREKKDFCDGFTAAKELLVNEFNTVKSNMFHLEESDVCTAFYSTKSTCCVGENCFDEKSLCLAIATTTVDEETTYVVTSEDCAAATAIVVDDVKVTVSCKVDEADMCTGCRDADNSLGVDSFKCIDSSKETENSVDVELCEEDIKKLDRVLLLKKCVDAPESEYIDFCTPSDKPAYYWAVKADKVDTFTCSKCEGGNKVYDNNDIICVYDDETSETEKKVEEAVFGKDECTEAPVFEGEVCAEDDNLKCTEVQKCVDPSGDSTVPVCQCLNPNKTGDQCEKCELGCLNGGKFDDACMTCACVDGDGSGYYGNKCDCTYGSITLVFSSFDESTAAEVSDVLKSEIPDVEFDVKVVASENNDAYAVVTITIKSCPREEVNSSRMSVTLAKMASAFKLASVEADVADAIKTIQAGLEKDGVFAKDAAFSSYDASVGVNVNFVGCDGTACINGCTNSATNCQAPKPDTTDSSGSDSSGSDSDDGGSDTGMIVGIVVGVVVLIAICITVYCCCTGCKSSGETKKESQMSPNDATAAYNEYAHTNTQQTSVQMSETKSASSVAYNPTVAVVTVKTADASQAPLVDDSEEAPLPPNWQECATEDGNIYYWNEVTEESLWERPTA